VCACPSHSQPGCLIPGQPQATVLGRAGVVMALRVRVTVAVWRKGEGGGEEVLTMNEEEGEFLSPVLIPP